MEWGELVFGSTTKELGVQFARFGKQKSKSLVVRSLLSLETSLELDVSLLPLEFAQIAAVLVLMVVAKR
jgi:hypothetical protein